MVVSRPARVGGMRTGQLTTRSRQGVASRRAWASGWSGPPNDCRGASATPVGCHRCGHEATFAGAPAWCDGPVAGWDHARRAGARHAWGHGWCLDARASSTGSEVREGRGPSGAAFRTVPLEAMDVSAPQLDRGPRHPAWTPAGGAHRASVRHRRKGPLQTGGSHVEGSECATRATHRCARIARSHHGRGHALERGHGHGPLRRGGLCLVRGLARGRGPVLARGRGPVHVDRVTGSPEREGVATTRPPTYRLFLVAGKRWTYS